MKRMKKLLSLFLVFALVLGLCALSALAAGRLTVASLEADKTAAAVGDTVTWTASASGGVGALRYAFYVYRGGERIYQGRYGTQPSFSYTPPRAFSSPAICALSFVTSA